MLQSKNRELPRRTLRIIETIVVAIEISTITFALFSILSDNYESPCAVKS